MREDHLTLASRAQHSGLHTIAAIIDGRAGTENGEAVKEEEQSFEQSLLLNPRHVGRSWVRREHTPLVVDCWLAFQHDRLLTIHKLLVIDLMPVDLVVFAQKVLDLQAITDWVRVAIIGVKTTFKAGGKLSPPRA